MENEMNDDNEQELTLADLSPAEILTAWKEGFPDEVAALTSATDGYDYQYLTKPSVRDVLKFSIKDLEEPEDQCAKGFGEFITHFNQGNTEDANG